MTRLWHFVRTHLWQWELACVAWLLLLPYILTAHGHLDFANHALGRDFVNYWTAGHLVAEGHIADIFDPARFLDAEHRLFDPVLPFHFWSYPPPALFLVAPLGVLPYIPALLVWSLFGVAVLIPVAKRLFADPKERLLLVFAPAVAINVGLGQNGAITAALLMGGPALWRRKPAWAGALFGLLAFKPQIGILLPIAVIAERRWKTLLWAAGVAVAVVAVSIPIFGLSAWRGFLGPTLTEQSLMLSQGTGPFQWMMPSTFMAARLIGWPTVMALTLQGPVSLFAAWTVWMTYRRGVDDEIKAAVLMTATFVATPQCFNYDLIPCAAAALVLWRRDQGVGKGLALLVWGLPILMISLQAVASLGLPAPVVALLVLASPLSLIGQMFRLYRLAVPASPSRSANASTAGEVASNT
jgi:hypothetical protein